MFLRISSAVLLATLAACSSKPASTSAASGETAVTVPCALAGAKTFTAACGLERSNLDGKVIVTLRHPDGGFRRLVELEGGKTFAAADGSDEAAIEANGKEIEVTLGDDHYLLPAPPGPTAAGSNAAKP